MCSSIRAAADAFTQISVNRRKLGRLNKCLEDCAQQDWNALQVPEEFVMGRHGRGMVTPSQAADLAEHAVRCEKFGMPLPPHMVEEKLLAFKLHNAGIPADKVELYSKSRQLPQLRIKKGSRNWRQRLTSE